MEIDSVHVYLRVSVCERERGWDFKWRYGNNGEKIVIVASARLNTPQLQSVTRLSPPRLCVRACVCVYTLLSVKASSFTVSISRLKLFTHVILAKHMGHVALKAKLRLSFLLIKNSIPHFAILTGSFSCLSTSGKAHLSSYWFLGYRSRRRVRAKE